MLVHLYIIKGHGHDHWSELIFINIFIERQRKKNKVTNKKDKVEGHRKKTRAQLLGRAIIVAEKQS